MYHFLHPDDVVSGRAYDEFGAALAGAGWSVSAFPCNRSCREPKLKFVRRETHHGIEIRRIWRPGFDQASAAGRLFNTCWMLAAWSLKALGRARTRPDLLIVGTDPPFSVVVARAWKLLSPRTKIVHWVHDLFPDAAVADGQVATGSRLERTLKRWARRAYDACDLIVDIGPCMRERIDAYSPRARRATIPIWALWEPEAVPEVAPERRRDLFGEARLGILYSGNFGRAHSCNSAIELARRLRGDDVRFTFCVRGNRVDELRAAVREDDSNIGFGDFAPEAGLGEQLVAADIHLVTLRDAWSGVVVPSKFAGALAAGRPVLFAGPRESAIARWIEQYRVGWVLRDDNVDAVAEELRALAREPEKLRELNARCHRVYGEHFSRKRALEQWAQALQALLPEGVPREKSPAKAVGNDPLRVESTH